MTSKAAFRRDDLSPVAVHGTAPWKTERCLVWKGPNFTEPCRERRPAKSRRVWKYPQGSTLSRHRRRTAGMDWNAWWPSTTPCGAIRVVWRHPSRPMVIWKHGAVPLTAAGAKPPRFKAAKSGGVPSMPWNTHGATLRPLSAETTFRRLPFPARP